MATAPVPISLEEFMSEYGGENGYEYWFGEVVRKGMGTRKHSLLADVLKELLRENGYQAVSEVDLTIDPNWRPRADVMGSLEPLEDPYQSKPVPVVMEVLSPDDRMNRVFRKCRNYVRVGIPQIFVFDPEARDAWEWSRDTDNLERIQEVRLLSATVIPVTTIWQRFDARLAG